MSDLSALPKAAISTDEVFVAFASWLCSVRQLAPTSVSLYVRAVLSSLKMCGFSVPSVRRGSILFAALKGASRLFADRQRPLREPLSPAVLERLLDGIARLSDESGCFQGLHSSVFIAVLLWSFFGLFRGSELVWSKTHRGLRLGDVRFKDSSGAWLTCSSSRAFLWQGAWVIDIDRSKTDQLGSGRTTLISRQPDSGRRCPASALSRYLSARLACRGAKWSDDEPLFLRTNAAPVRDRDMNLILKLVSSACSLSGVYRFHSGRIGGASCADATGVSRSAIKALGHWSSDPGNMGYIRQSAAHIAATQSSISAAGDPLFLSAARVSRGHVRIPTGPSRACAGSQARP